MMIGEFIPFDGESPDLEAVAPPALDRRKISLYVQQAHYRAIRKMAADRDMKMQNVLDEALTAFFKTTR